MASTLTYTVADFQPFTKIISADVNSRFNDIKSRFNWAGGSSTTTGLSDDNIQSNSVSGGGLTRATKLKLGTPDHVLINDGTGAMSSEAILARSRGGLQFVPSLATNGGKAVVVNDAETALELGSPSQASITQSLSGDIVSLTAGEGIAANDAVCLDLHNGTGTNIYRVFRCDDSKPNRRRNFLGFATAAATVTAGVYTYTISAPLVTSNVITSSLNGRSYVTTFASSSDATLQSIATQLATDPDVASAVVTVVGGNQTSNDDRVIVVTSRGGLSLNMAGVVTAGASQATITVLNTQAASGGNVRIRNFGLLGGFVSLNIGNLYYLADSAGAITDAPSSTNPIAVGQALTATQLFVTPNSFVYQFGTPAVFVKSHGGTTNSGTTATQTSEHYNFVSWSVGASSTAGIRMSGQAGGNGLYNGFHHQLDGINAGGAPALLFQRYNKASWVSLTNRTTPQTGCGVYSFVGFYHALAGGSGVQHDKWNGSSWIAGTAVSSGNNSPGCFVTNNKLSYAGGVSTAVHKSFDAADVESSETAIPAGGMQGGSSSTGDATLASGITTVGTTANSYKWSGSSWSSAITVTYITSATTGTGTGAACGHNIATNKTYLAGGSDGSNNSISTAASYNNVSWSAETSSSTARQGAVGSVL